MQGMMPNIVLIELCRIEMDFQFQVGKEYEVLIELCRIEMFSKRFLG